MRKIISGLVGVLAAAGLFLTCGAAAYRPPTSHAGPPWWTAAIKIDERIGTDRGQAELAAVVAR